MFLPGNQRAADGQPFQLVLVRAMIGAAKADGHVDGVEPERLADAGGEFGLCQGRLAAGQRSDRQGAAGPLQKIAPIRGGHRVDEWFPPHNCSWSDSHL